MKWALVFLALALSARDAADSSPLVGTVVSAGRPVAGAQVEWRAGNTALQTVSGEDGTFVLNAPSVAGKLTVRMFGFAPGFAETPAGMSRPAAVVQLEVDGVIAPPAAIALQQPRQTQQNGNSSEEDISLLIQGSISRGLSEQNEPDAMAMFMRGGFGMLTWLACPSSAATRAASAEDRRARRAA